MKKLKKELDVVIKVVLWIMELNQNIVAKFLVALGDYLQKIPQEWNKLSFVK